MTLLSIPLLSKQVHYHGPYIVLMIVIISVTIGSKAWRHYQKLDMCFCMSRIWEVHIYIYHLSSGMQRWDKKKRLRQLLSFEKIFSMPWSVGHQIYHTAPLKTTYKAAMIWLKCINVSSKYFFLRGGWKWHLKTPFLCEFKSLGVFLFCIWNTQYVHINNGGLNSTKALWNIICFIFFGRQIILYAQFTGFIWL